MTELEKAWEKATSLEPGKDKISLTFIGEIDKHGRKYRFYKTDSGEYKYESDGYIPERKRHAVPHR